MRDRRGDSTVYSGNGREGVISFQSSVFSQNWRMADGQWSLARSAWLVAVLARGLSAQKERALRPLSSELVFSDSPFLLDFAILLFTLFHEEMNVLQASFSVFACFNFYYVL